ncbi:DUF6163 family protein [Phreatobacter stygius]|uniref:DoxX family protein n=1 Tax=Phreatobacter stygius TaxID=1940610 RepID=A0A4D7B9M0_9HYPH|nr:DUF6163 family protein [Phreatobacter stygius]QCI67565.1 hypothetical protein E8M01_27080 [Phreatobacter stygius]
MSTTKPRLSGDAPIQAHVEVRLDWVRILTWFLRALALLALGRGLVQWAIICGFHSLDGLDFEQLAPGLQTATIFFAVIQLVAGVGLWLTAAWGGVVWIIATLVALVIDASAPIGVQGWVETAGRPLFASAADILLILFYVVIATMAARQIDHGSGD